GVRPFELEGSATRLLHDAPPIASAKANVHIPEPVEALVRRLLAREPDDRFQTAYDVLEAIEASGSWTPRTRTTPRPTALPVKPRARRRLRLKLPTDLLTGVAAGLLFFALVMAFFRTRGSEAAPDSAPSSPSSVTHAALR